MMPRGSPSARVPTSLKSSISADPKIRAGGGRASPAVALAAVRAKSRKIMLKV